MYTNVEIVALVASVLLLIKILFVSLSPGSWSSFTKRVYSFPKLLGWLSIILACLVLSFLLREVTITQIFVSGIFLALIAIAGISLFHKEMLSFKESLISKLKLSDYWWYLVLWLIIAIWVLEEVLTK